ncbi:MAG: Asd/ArgC dimerization domain-containing protein [Myxococcota bacterium]
MATRGLRVAVTGATGALGTEVLGVLDASQLRIGQLITVAGEASLGEDIEFQDEIVSVDTELPALHGLDLVINCAPAAESGEIVRAALRAEVPCVDASGAFAEHAEVPLAWAASGRAIERAPLLAAPADAALVWLPVLQALEGVGELVRVTGTVLEAASASGRAGIDALSLESLALFNQQEIPEDAGIGRPLAFDCHPTSGDAGAQGRHREQLLSDVIGRELTPAPKVSARWIQVPTFLGQASSLCVEFASAPDAAAAREQLAKASGLELWEGGGEGPNLRAVSGREVVVVSAPDADAATPNALRLWAMADLLRLAAYNAIALAAGLLEAEAPARPH